MSQYFVAALRRQYTALASISLSRKIKMAWLNQSAGLVLQISDGLLILLVFTVVLDCCIMLVFGSCFCLEYLEGGCSTGQSRSTFVFFEYTANVS